MALYDRKYIQDSTMYETGARTQQSDLSTFIKQTYQLFAASLLAASAGSYVGLSMVSTIHSAFWLFAILEIGLFFGLMMAKRKAGLNLILLFAFTFVSGLTIAPLISRFLMAGAGHVVLQTFVLTTVAFGALSVFAMNTKKDFSTWGKALFITLIVVFVGSLINMFFYNSMVHLIMSIGGALLFSAYVLYDTQNIIRGAYETPIEGAIALYLDFVNIFVSLLQVFGILGSDD